MISLTPVEKSLLSLLTSGLWTRKPAVVPSLSEGEWMSLVESAASQTVSGLVWKGLSLAGISAGASAERHSEEIPMQALAMLAIRVDKCERAYRKAVELTESLMTEYEAAGLHPVLLKGISSAMLYDIPELRASGDIDLYFPPYEFLKAIPKGAKISSDNARLFSFHGMTVEIHDRIADLDRPVSVREANRIFSESGTMRKGNICMLSPRMRILLLASHPMKHSFGRGVGLRHICDYAHARTRDDYDHALFESDCRSLGLSRWVEVLDLLCTRYLGMPDYSSQKPHAKNVERLAERLLRMVLAEGNFGRRSRGSSLAATFSAFVSKLGFAVSISLPEYFFLLKALISGRIKKYIKICKS